MPAGESINSADLQRRESHLMAFACAAIAVLAGGMALFMYPAVFLPQDSSSSDKALRIAFVGFCVLCVLLTAYIWDNRATIGRLQRQMEADSKRMDEVRRQASTELLSTIPRLSFFHDILAMECRRTSAMSENLSVLVVTVRSSTAPLSPTAQISIFGDAAKAIFRKLRSEDSIYRLRRDAFGVILPGVSKPDAQLISARVAEGLADAAGADGRFSCKIDVISYLHQASSAHDLQQAICSLLPSVDPTDLLAEDSLI